jgi:hypothetical protein
MRHILAFGICACAVPMAMAQELPPPQPPDEGLSRAREAFGAQWAAHDSAGLSQSVLGGAFVLSTPATAAPLQGEAALATLLRLVRRRVADSLRLSPGPGGGQEGSLVLEQGQWHLYVRRGPVERGHYRAQWRRVGDRAWRLASLLWVPGQ